MTLVVTYELALKESTIWPKYEGVTLDIIHKVAVELKATAEGVAPIFDRREVIIFSEGDTVAVDFVSLEDLRNDAGRASVLGWAIAKMESDLVMDPDAEYLTPPEGTALEQINSLEAWKKNLAERLENSRHQENGIRNTKMEMI